MAKPARFIPKNHPTRGWELNIPASHSATGRRAKWYFETQKQALNAAADLKEKVVEHGKSWKHASPLVISDAEQARETLAPWGIGIAAAAAQYAAAMAILEPSGIDLLEAAKKAAKQAAAESQSVSLADAWTAYLATKGRLADDSLKAYRQLRASMEKHFMPQRSLATVGGVELDKFLTTTTGGKGTHKNGRLRNLQAFWRWCAKPPRKWCNPESCEMLEAVNLTRKDIAVIDAGQVAELFQQAEAHHPELVPWLALSIYGGCRQIEIHRMKVSDISSEGIAIDAENKTGRRFIHMPPPLAAWLKAYPFPKDKDNKPAVLPPEFEAQYDKLRNRAGWRVVAAGLPAPKADAPKWPQNVLRHTAASLVLGIGKPVDILIFEHGHSGGVTTLKKHYLGRMPRSVAEAIWTFGPHGTKIPLIAAAPERKAVASW